MKKRERSITGCDRRMRYCPYGKPVQDVSQCKATEARRRRSDGSKWREVVEQKAFSTEAVGSIWHGALRVQAVGMLHHSKKLWADGESVRRNGTDGRWQHETSFEEELELVRHSTDLRCEGVPMRRAHNAWIVRRMGQSTRMYSWEMASSAYGQVRR